MNIEADLAELGEAGRAVWDQLSLGIPDGDILAQQRALNLCRHVDRCGLLHALTLDQDGAERVNAALFKEANNAAVLLERLVAAANDLLERAVQNGAQLSTPSKKGRPFYTTNRKIGGTAGTVTALDRFRKAANGAAQ